jgi:hypothetical protein
LKPLALFLATVLGFYLMGKKKNPAAVALGRLAASKRTAEELREAGRRGGQAKAANRLNGMIAAALEPDTEVAESPTSISRNVLFRDGVDQRNHEASMKRQEKRLKRKA